MRKNFGRVLREFRELKGISQEKLALEAGIDRSYVGRLERNIHSPTVDILFTISKVLQIRASEIIARMER